MVCLTPGLEGISPDVQLSGLFFDCMPEVIGLAMPG
jgi:hypothetical protein